MLTMTTVQSPVPAPGALEPRSGKVGHTWRVTDEKYPAGTRDALALAELCLDARRDDHGIDLGACNAIIRNGDPAEIAVNLAVMFAACLTALERAKRIPSAAGFLAGLREQHAPGGPGS